jgi:glycosyltransferase involved in cell wall biosynthesis
MKIALITNILTPYRSFFYDKLNNHLLNLNIDFKVFVMAETESNRNWYYNQYKTSYTELMENINLGKRDIYINKHIKKKFEAFDPDVVIAAGGYQMPTILRLLTLKKQLNFKLLFWSESNLVKRENLTGVNKYIRELIRKITYSNFDGFWYSGKYSKDFIDKYAPSSKEMYFLPNLVDNQLYSKVQDLREMKYKALLEKYNIYNSKKIFLCPARLSEQKGILEFLSLFMKCNNADEATILIAGDGELKATISKLIHNNKHLDIRLLGYKTQAEMLELYAIADFLLLPSIVDPNPLSCIEALWCGLPLLITKHVGNNPEVLIDGENGYVFSYEDIQKSISQIEKAISANEEWIKNAQRLSRSIANELFHPDKAISTCIDGMIRKFN